MGTNYYIITKSKKLVHEYFYGEYELSDEPFFHYRIHLNKLSCGWKPLFQNHNAFTKFADLIEFCKAHKKDISIWDEYGEVFTLDEYIREILEHANVEREPRKWVYEEDNLCGRPGKKYLQTVPCNPEEADLWAPYDHIEKTLTEREAQKKYKAWDAYISLMKEERYHRDPDYPVDWVEGEFS